MRGIPEAHDVYVSPMLIDHGRVSVRTRGVANGDTIEGLALGFRYATFGSAATNGDTASDCETADSAEEH